jgi:hypothetical protein
MIQFIIQKYIDVAFLQEPYRIRNEVTGFPKYLKTLAKVKSERDLPETLTSI